MGEALATRRSGDHFLAMANAFAAAATAAALSAVSIANPLGRFIDRARVLVVSAPAASDPRLRRQDHDLASFSAEMSDRDLVTVHVVGDRATDTRGDILDASAVRRVAGVSANGFNLVLIGEDGGVKLRRKLPTAVDVILQTIDAMPMRRQEILHGRPPRARRKRTSCSI